MLCSVKCAALVGAVALSLVDSTLAQTFRRSNACPTLGCIYPPDQTDFIAGQLFDIRVEVQAPINGTQPYNGGVVNNDYTLQIGIDGAQSAKNVEQFFGNVTAQRTNYTFTYYEDLFARDNKTLTGVNVTSASYRSLALYSPGHYTATLYFNGGSKSVAHWTVKEPSTCRKAKNAILFIGDGMTTNMITAARMLGHKSINGKYQSRMTMDSAPSYGTQMSHSIDSFITDSANSASALYSGKKTTVNALNSYTDSSGNAFTAAKFETVFEMHRRVNKGQIGIVSTAFLSDATPAAVMAHTPQRSQYDLVVEQYLNGVTANYSGWGHWDGPDVLFGGGAEQWLPNKANGNKSQFDRWAQRGYGVALNKTQLTSLPNDQRALGLFTQGNISTWLDRNVYPKTLDLAIKPMGGRGAYDQPGLKDMTLKALDILHTRSKANGDVGFLMMAEAALIDKEMHVLDYDRALGEVLDLDSTLNATLAKLKELGIAEDTLVVVTADHGHGFDVFGSADTVYLSQQTGDRKKRDAVGTYQNSGLSGYQVSGPMVNPSENFTVVYSAQGPGFPVTWDPRYAAAMGFGANPDHREDYAVHKDKQRDPANAVSSNSTTNYYVNPEDAVDGFIVNGTLPVSNDQGVHSLTDVPVYAYGPSAARELFNGVQNSVDIAFNLALALDLGKTYNATKN